LPRDFDFAAQLGMSQGQSANTSIKDILLSNIPGAVNCHQAHTINDRNGIDWWIEHSAGKFLSVDCKVREEDWAARGSATDDLALETFSVVEKNIAGWTRSAEKKTDYVLWLWLDTGRWLLVPFPMLCSVFSREWNNWRHKFKTARQRTVRGNGEFYHSECVFVPRRTVWEEIYRQYGGQR